MTQRGAAETSSGNTFPQSTIILGSKYITHKDLLQAEKKKKNSNFAKKHLIFAAFLPIPEYFQLKPHNKSNLHKTIQKNSKFYINLIFSRHKMSLCARYIIQARYILYFKVQRSPNTIQRIFAFWCQFPKSGMKSLESDGKGYVIQSQRKTERKRGFWGFFSRLSGTDRKSCFCKSLCVRHFYGTKKASRVTGW